MHLRRIAIVAVFCTVVSAHASIISGTISGTIAPGTTTDLYGYFGAPGANLSGESLSLTYSYDTADFESSPYTCGYLGCQAYRATTIAPSESVSFTIGGITQIYYPSSDYQLIFENNTSVSTGYGFGVVILNQDASRGEYFGQFSADSVAFGQPITPSANFLSDIYLYSTAGQEVLTYLPSTVSATPEPSSLLLSITGVAGSVICGAKKRFSRGRL